MRFWTISIPTLKIVDASAHMHTCSTPNTQMPNEQVLKCSSAQMIKCSNAQMLKCSNVQMLKCSNAQMLKCSNAWMLKCSNAQMLKCSNAQTLKCSNAQMAMPEQARTRTRSLCRSYSSIAFLRLPSCFSAMSSATILARRKTHRNLICTHWICACSQVCGIPISTCWNGTGRVVLPLWRIFLRVEWMWPVFYTLNLCLQCVRAFVYICVHVCACVCMCVHVCACVYWCSCKNATWAFVRRVFLHLRIPNMCSCPFVHSYIWATLRLCVCGFQHL